MAILKDLVVVPINSGKYLRSYSKGDRIGSYVMHSVFNVSSGATEISFDIYQHVRRKGEEELSLAVSARDELSKIN